MLFMLFSSLFLSSSISIKFSLFFFKLFNQKKQSNYGGKERIVLNSRETNRKSIYISIGGVLGVSFYYVERDLLYG